MYTCAAVHWEETQKAIDCAEAAIDGIAVQELFPGAESSLRPAQADAEAELQIKPALEGSVPRRTRGMGRGVWMPVWAHWPHTSRGATWMGSPKPPRVLLQPREMLFCSCRERLLSFAAAQLCSCLIAGKISV